MLLLVDCKDRILLTTSYSLLRSRTNGQKKSEIVSDLSLYVYTNLSFPSPTQTLPEPDGSLPSIDYGDVGTVCVRARVCVCV